ncbi:hypothetical protein XA68_14476 [Ophiocordyceps unilateralis]|uniref:eRF1/Pelota-like N-terminal domain-containing protein n=1 Tax=Ophiocordyceps unilateralis TaxID=268505 RepID=A0A2A9PAB2_OPHUN|nr:hypothetical protein XA68_14476 [Ophiocordyceps unilateralis]
MKLVARKVLAEAEQVSLLPEDPEDMWHAYNLIVAGDLVNAHAIRKVVTINAVDLFRSRHLLATRLRRFNRSFTVIKPDGWDSVSKATLAQALSDDKNGALAAVVMQDGLANICLINQFRTVLKTRVESVVPKKRDTASDQDAGLRRFFEKTLSSLLRALDFSDSRPLLLASPGFVATDFKDYIAKQGRDKSDKALTAMAKQATVIHSNSGHVHGLNEVLKSPQVLAKMRNMNYAKEAQYMDNFFDMLKLDDGRAWYGTKAVEKAVADGAVGPGGGVLLINNSLFRSQVLETRKKYVTLVDKVKEIGGETRILSSDHESGQRLKMMGDVAATLNYPMLDLDEDEDEEGEAPETRDLGTRHELDESMLESVV